MFTKTILAAVVMLSTMLASVRPSYATPCDPTGTDAQAIADARALVASTCSCAAATNHGDYVKCSGRVLADRVIRGFLRPQCKGRAQICAANSTCGKKVGAVTCCVTNKFGKTNCAFRPDAAHCKTPIAGSACVGVHASCCDACTASGCASPSAAFLDDSF